jgi:hypothetical protein
VPGAKARWGMQPGHPRVREPPGWLAIFLAMPPGADPQSFSAFVTANLSRVLPNGTSDSGLYVVVVA